MRPYGVSGHWGLGAGGWGVGGGAHPCALCYRLGGDRLLAAPTLGHVPKKTQGQGLHTACCDGEGALCSSRGGEVPYTSARFPTDSSSLVRIPFSSREPACSSAALAQLCARGLTLCGYIFPGKKEREPPP